MHPIFATRSANARPIWFVTEATYRNLRPKIGAAALFADAVGFEPKPARHAVVPGKKDGEVVVLCGLEPPGAADPDLFLPGRLPSVLADGVYRFANAPHDLRIGTLAFALGAYRFARYRAKGKAPNVRLAPPPAVDARDLTRIIDGVALARDLVNTPANDMGPAELERAARTLARTHGARVRTVVGDDLLARGYPLVHAVGRASDRAPRVIDVTWGNPKHPKVTLVGKGVCFDTGGLDIKPDSAMLLMKKDMGGAAAALALAHMIMARRIPIRLRVLIPAVENAVSGRAFRPLDVYPSRKGLTVEIGNTDAEGRLVLADALAAADEEKPDLLIDLGTLTGAARVALGPDLPPFYTSSDALAAEVARCAAEESDPLWRMPLWRRYDRLLDSKVADVGNVSSGSFAGSITCALFLQRFVSAAKEWLHLDIYAWNPSERPGRPEGGECQAARALYALLKRRYAPAAR